VRSTVWIPTVDERWLILLRYMQPSSDTKLLIEKLRLELPNQPPPLLTAQTEGNEIHVTNHLVAGPFVVEPFQ
jgi:hypothetical protein